VQNVQTSEPSITIVRQARSLAVVASVLMPMLIALVAYENGYAPIVIAQALALWALGTVPWLGYNWRLIKPQRIAVR